MKTTLLTFSSLFAIIILEQLFKCLKKGRMPMKEIAPKCIYAESDSICYQLATAALNIASTISLIICVTSSS